MTTAIVAPTDAQLDYLADRKELERLRAVVAAQREALLGVAARATPGPGTSYLVPDKAIKRVRAALDAEGVSEPGAESGSSDEPQARGRRRTSGAAEASPAEGQAHAEQHSAGPGSLTSPVDGGKL